MDISEALAERLRQRALAKALAFAADPSAGRAEGYEPERVWRREPSENGEAGALRSMRSDYAAWLYTVARKDLPPGRWRIDEGMGEGPGSAELVILR